jgi:hypothetical protein
MISNCLFQSNEALEVSTCVFKLHYLTRQLLTVMPSFAIQVGGAMKVDGSVVLDMKIQDRNFAGNQAGTLVAMYTSFLLLLVCFVFIHPITHTHSH